MVNTLLNRIRQDLSARAGSIVVLTGAGISAESGIPTFRGPEGYWTVGSREYRPEEMATFRMYRSHPSAVWQWYLFRRTICQKAQPNAAHHALVDLEKKLENRFLLITQNVDGLHIRAGNSLKRIYQIHGNINYMRCGAACTDKIYMIPDSIKEREKNEPLCERDHDALRCPVCGNSARPHVLWFDEYYDEQRYRVNSSIKAAANADVLLSVGTSGATNLPIQIVSIAAQRGALLIDVNPNSNPFSEIAESSGGSFLKGKAGQILPELVEIIDNSQS